MSTTPAKTLSPAELAKLEHAFASDPSSEAYKPLAEAYLGMGRFMEAMVVCKKGVKAHPTASSPRLLLARVYAEQGKDKKALEEALGALQVQPTDKLALRLAGALQLKTGEMEPGRANLLRAYEADPSDAETRALMQQHQVEVPRAAVAPPPPPPVVAAPPAAAAPAPARTPVTGPGAPPVLRPSPAAGAPQQPPAPRAAASAPSAVRAVATPPAPRPAPRPVQRVEAYEEEDEDEELGERSRRPARSSTGRKVALTLMVALPLAVAGYAGYGRWSAQRNYKFKKYLGEATEELKHDSYDSYRKASEAADQALEVDPDSTAAHGYLAYAYAIRWGEHGGGDAARQQAEDHLASGKKTGEVSSYLYAADALLKTYSGKGNEALGELEGRVKAFDAQGKASPLLYLTLGLIQTNAGDLERARDSLERAQALAPDDARVYAALGALYRRRGQDNQAWKNYDFALRYEKNHPASLLGRSLLMLEQDQPNYELVAKMLKTLLESDPPPSPRQLATAHLARSLLVSRLSRELPDFKPEYQQKLSQSTGVPLDKEQARAEMLKSEETGFALDRTNPELLVIKGRRLMGEGQYDAAAQEIRRAIAQDPSRAQYHVELARALMGKPGGEGEAAQALTTALRTMGNSPKLVLMLGNAYRRQGKTAEALAAYDRALLDPKVKNPEARLAMGSVYRERGELAKAQEALEKASQEFVGQGDRVAATLTELGRVLAAKGDVAKADETFQKALTADESYAPAYFHYASFLAKEGKQAAKARSTAQEYLKREPKGEFAADAQRLAE